jgi:hypothetical protein
VIASGTLAVELNIKTRLPGCLTRFESQLTLKRISNETQRHPHSLSFPAATNSLFMCLAQAVLQHGTYLSLAKTS